MTEQKSLHEPLFHISKRAALPWWKAWLIRAAAVLAALVISSIIIVIVVGENPFKIFASLIDGNFGTSYKFWTMLENVALLLCVALAVTPAFKMKFWNIGAEGQVLIGALAATACIMYLGDSVSEGMLIVFMIAAALIAGIIWAVIPALFKAFFNTNETLFTLMMNYIAMNLVVLFINIWVTSGSGVLGVLSKGHFPVIAGNKSLLTVLVVAIVTALMFVYLKYTKHGYEISVVGDSLNTAKYSGMNVKKIIIRTLALSGAVCGLVGVLLVGSVHHTLNSSLADGRGFTAIIVSWLAKFNPLYMILTAFLVVFFQRGANQLASDFYASRVTEDFGDIIVGIIFFFIIGCEFFIRYIVKFRKKHKETASFSDFLSEGDKVSDGQDNEPAALKDNALKGEK